MKTVIIEPRTTDALNPLLSKYKSLIGENKPAMVFGVCRGKLSEGLDFADGHCRLVIIAGLPLAPYRDKKVAAMRNYLNEERRKGAGRDKENSGAIGGDEWYTLQATVAINQAIGRVIRHRFDYGAILFLDDRFGKSGVALNGLSKWVKKEVIHGEDHGGFGSIMVKLAQFFSRIKTDEALMAIAPMGGKKYEEGGFDEATRRERRIKGSAPGGSQQKDYAKGKVVRVKSSDGDGGYLGGVSFDAGDEAEGNIAIESLRASRKEPEKVGSLKEAYFRIGGGGSGFSERAAVKKSSSAEANAAKHRAAAEKAAVSAKGIDARNEYSSLPAPPKSAARPNPYAQKASEKMKKIMSGILNASSADARKNVEKRKKARLGNLLRGELVNREKSKAPPFPPRAPSRSAAAKPKPTQADAAKFQDSLKKNLSSDDFNVIRGLIASVKTNKVSIENSALVRGAFRDMISVFLKRGVHVGRIMFSGLLSMYRHEEMTQRTIYSVWEEAVKKLAEKEQLQDLKLRKSATKMEEVSLPKSSIHNYKISKTGTKRVSSAEEPAPPQDFSTPQQRDEAIAKFSAFTKAQEIMKNRKEEAMKKVREHEKFAKLREKSAVALARPIGAPSAPSTMRPTKRAKSLAAANSSISTFLESRTAKTSSYVPKDAVCNICKSTAVNPHMGRCKHICCLNCWEKWFSQLDRQGACHSCPYCRQNIQEDDLYKVIWDDEKAAREVKKTSHFRPTLSQPCTNDHIDDDNDDDSDDDDLIIVK